MIQDPTVAGGNVGRSGRDALKLHALFQVLERVVQRVLLVSPSRGSAPSAPRGSEPRGRPRPGERASRSPDARNGDVQSLSAAAGREGRSRMRRGSRRRTKARLPHSGPSPRPSAPGADAGLDQGKVPAGGVAEGHLQRGSEHSESMSVPVAKATLSTTSNRSAFWSRSAADAIRVRTSRPSTGCLAARSQRRRRIWLPAPSSQASPRAARRSRRPSDGPEDLHEDVGQATSSRATAAKRAGSAALPPGPPPPA